MKITGYTNKFKEKWLANFGAEPVVDEINDYLLYKAQRIQKFIPAIRFNTTSDKNVLASYWVPSKHIVIKVDTNSRSAVELHTEQDTKKRDEEGNLD